VKSKKSEPDYLKNFTQFGAAIVSVKFLVNDSINTTHFMLSGKLFSVIQAAAGSGLVKICKNGSCRSPLDKLLLRRSRGREQITVERFVPTPRTTIRRLPERGEYDWRAIYSILDEAFICHVGFVHEGQPFVIPTGYGRVDDQIYIHGSAASRMLRSIARGLEVCITVTLVDGLVLARSAFHHSINYRSVVILGTAILIEDLGEKMVALKAITNHIVPGRWDDVREPNNQELKGTTVLALKLLEASAKVRTGPPKDDEEDHDIRAWAGELPLRMECLTPIDDPRLLPGIAPPAYVLNYSRGEVK
jgi:uncharacterized protein